MKKSVCVPDSTLVKSVRRAKSRRNTRKPPKLILNERPKLPSGGQSTDSLAFHMRPASTKAALSMPGNSIAPNGKPMTNPSTIGNRYSLLKSSDRVAKSSRYGYPRSEWLPPSVQ